MQFDEAIAMMHDRVKWSATNLRIYAIYEFPKLRKQHNDVIIG